MKLQFGLGMLLGLFLAGRQGLDARSIGQQQRSGLTLAVCDQTALDPQILVTARQHTLQILSSAGVDVTWVDLDSGSKCKMPAEGQYFVVAILPKAPQGWASPDAMGYAASRTGSYPRAYVFYDHVQIMVNIVETTDRRSLAMGIVLGHAIAHELGHLLIPGKAHSLTGIMSTAWNRRHWEDAAAGRLLFNEDQAKAIHNALYGK